MKCSKCHGRGEERIECSYCDGRGRTSCTACLDGTVPEWRNGKIIDRTCRFCRGTREVRCPSCNGQRHDWLSCRSCGGTGQASSAENDNIVQSQEKSSKVRAIAPIFCFHHKSDWHYYYSSLPRAGDDWVYDGTAFFAFNEEDEEVAPVYQFHTPDWRYYYSLDMSVSDEWTCDGIAFYGYSQANRYTKPVYQFHTPDWRYYYSLEPIAGAEWINDGPVFHVFKATVANITLI